MITGDGFLKAGARFFKGHGLGNDYIVFEVGDDWVMRPESIAVVCDRWRGPGSDGAVSYTHLTLPTSDLV